MTDDKKTPKAPDNFNTLEFEKEFPIKTVWLPNTFTVQPCLGGEIGDLVAVRPTDPEFEGKTFLGILIGNVPIGLNVSVLEEEKLMRLRPIENPLIFLPNMKAFVYGSGSWWHPIGTEADLKNITDDDIEKVWTLRAIKQIADKKKGAKSDG